MISSDWQIILCRIVLYITHEFSKEKFFKLMQGVKGLNGKCQLSMRVFKTGTTRRLIAFGWIYLDDFMLILSCEYLSCLQSVKIEAHSLRAYRKRKKRKPKQVLIVKLNRY